MKKIDGLIVASLFERGHGVLTLGNEATVVRDVIMQNCLVTGKIPLARLKLRPDTPQHYENIHFRDITLTSTEPSFKDVILEIQPRTQYFDLQGQPKPKSVVRNVTMNGIKGNFGSFGEIQGNRDQTKISDIFLQDVDVHLRNERLVLGEVKNLKTDNAFVNGKPFSLK